MRKRVDPTFHSIVGNGSFLLVSTEKHSVEANMALGVPRQEAEKMNNDDHYNEDDDDDDVDGDGDGDDDAQAGGGGDD